jgi:type IV pilus assembly protein PilM
MFVFGKKKSSFGIDIGTQTIKVAEISSKNNVFSIDNYSIWDDEIENFIQEKNNDNFLPTQEITKIISTMLNASKMKIDKAYVALPSYLAFFAIISMPLLTEEELVTAVPLEAKNHIPVPLQNIQLDWINLGKNKAQDKYNIFIIAIPNNTVARYIDVAKSLNIEIQGFELDCFSIIRSINLPQTQNCIIDIGGRNSTVMILDKDKKLQAMQSFDFGGNQITHLISQLKNIPIIEAEKIKKQNGIIGEDILVSDLIKSSIKMFIENDVFKFINSVKDVVDLNISNIILLGGSSKMKGVQNFLDMLFKNTLNKQNIVISMATPIKNLKVKGVENNEKFFNIWCDLILSTGVALKNYIE